MLRLFPPDGECVFDKRDLNCDFLSLIMVFLNVPFDLIVGNIFALQHSTLSLT